jgi:hypothetical protein
LPDMQQLRVAANLPPRDLAIVRHAA